MHSPDLTLVVLAYDEEDNVAPYLDECLRYIDGLSGNHEVVLVDDGSRDQTAARARAVAERDARVRVFSHEQNRGMGAGMRTGLTHARKDYLVFLPADGQVPPVALDQLLPHLASAPIVLSVYSRRPHERYRVAMSVGLRLLIRALLQVDFRLEGIYLIPVALVRDQIGLDRLRSDTFFFSFELLYYALRSGARAHTVTIEPSPRMGGRSKVANPRRVARVASELVRFRLRLWRERVGG